MTTVPMQQSAEVDAKPEPDDERLTSVTTILGSTGDPEGLINWAANATAEAAVRKRGTLEAMIRDDGEAAAISWLAQQRYKPPQGERSATALGSAVHAAIEYLVVNGKRPPHGYPFGGKLGEMDAEVDPYLDSFDLFLDTYQPEFTAAEMTVYNTSYGYAGTLDGMMRLEGQHLVADYKTSKKEADGRGNRSKPWKSVVLQTTGYRHAEFAAVWRARKHESYGRRYYLLSAEEREQAVPMPPTDGGICIHITPRHCDIWPVPTGDDIFDRFLYAIENARTDLELSKGWLQEPIMLLDRKAS